MEDMFAAATIVENIFLNSPTPLMCVCVLDSRMKRTAALGTERFLF